MTNMLGNLPRYPSFIWVQVMTQDSWSQDTDGNLQFITDVYQGASGTPVGIFTTAADWNNITNNANGQSQFGALWYSGSSSIAAR